MKRVETTGGNWIKWIDGEKYEGYKTGYEEKDLNLDGKGMKPYDIFRITNIDSEGNRITKTLTTKSEYLHDNLIPLPDGIKIELECKQKGIKKLWYLSYDEEDMLNAS